MRNRAHPIRIVNQKSRFLQQCLERKTVGLPHLHHVDHYSRVELKCSTKREAIPSDHAKRRPKTRPRISTETEVASPKLQWNLGTNWPREFCSRAPQADKPCEWEPSVFSLKVPLGGGPSEQQQGGWPQQKQDYGWESDPVITPPGQITWGEYNQE